MDKTERQFLFEKLNFVIGKLLEWENNSSNYHISYYGMNYLPDNTICFNFVTNEKFYGLFFDLWILDLNEDELYKYYVLQHKIHEINKTSEESSLSLYNALELQKKYDTKGYFEKLKWDNNAKIIELRNKIETDQKNLKIYKGLIKDKNIFEQAVNEKII